MSGCSGTRVCGRKALGRRGLSRRPCRGIRPDENPAIVRFVALYDPGRARTGIARTMARARPVEIVALVAAAFSFRGDGGPENRGCPGQCDPACLSGWYGRLVRRTGADRPALMTVRIVGQAPRQRRGAIGRRRRKPERIGTRRVGRLVAAAGTFGWPETCRTVPSNESGVFGILAKKVTFVLFTIRL